MTDSQKPKIYRDAIDALVHACREGQGQIGPTRVRAGVWNRNASPRFIPDQYAIDELLSRMSQPDREVLARMLEEQMMTGVFEALKVLEQFGVSPFEDGYEGSPYNDFVGRMSDWEWPES